MDISCLRENRTFPTGTVKVSLDSGKPSYEICINAAWDHLESSPELPRFGATVDAVCFGSLGQRMETSRKTIQSFVRAFTPAALKILDINLRLDFYSREIIRNGTYPSTPPNVKRRVEGRRLRKLAASCEHALAEEVKANG